VSFETALHKAVFERLSGFSGLPDVYDHVPQQRDSGSDVSFPYITVGDDTHVPFDTDDSVGAESTITVHAWSRKRGRAEVKGIQAGIREALQRFDLDVEGFALVTIEFDYSESFMDQDTLTRHGVQRFRVLLDQT
jgi:hypothetical protein